MEHNFSPLNTDRKIMAGYFHHHLAFTVLSQLVFALKRQPAPNLQWLKSARLRPETTKLDTIDLAINSKTRPGSGTNLRFKNREPPSTNRRLMVLRPMADDK